MAKYDRFEDLPAWQESARLYNAVLDLLETPNLPLTAGFRNQLDRAALSVSNNIAEGFERSSTAELLSFLAIARGSAGEVRSMLLVVNSRQKMKAYSKEIGRIQALAKSCSKQITAWINSVEGSTIKGKRYLTPVGKENREVADKAAEFRRNFLKNLSATHPLYNTPEAQAARGEIAT
ncbi:MAG: four helix bundle protein [Limisphaerales bacterium]